MERNNWKSRVMSVLGENEEIRIEYKYLYCIYNTQTGECLYHAKSYKSLLYRMLGY